MINNFKEKEIRHYPPSIIQPNKAKVFGVKSGMLKSIRDSNGKVSLLLRGKNLCWR